MNGKGEAMSIILKGIDSPKMGECRRIVIYDNGDVVVKEERWDEDGYKHYKTFYDVKAIQIPKNHGRLIDGDELVKHLRKDPLFDLVERYGISGVIESRPTILDKERE